MEDTTPDFQDLLAAFDIPDMRVKISEVRSLAPVSSSSDVPKTTPAASTSSPPIVKQEPGVDLSQPSWQPTGDDAVHQGQGSQVSDAAASDVDKLNPNISVAASTTQPESVKSIANGSTVSNGDGSRNFFQTFRNTDLAQHSKVVSSTLQANSWAKSPGSSTVTIVPKPIRPQKTPPMVTSVQKLGRPTMSIGSIQLSKGSQKIVVASTKSLMANMRVAMTNSKQPLVIPISKNAIPPLIFGRSASQQAPSKNAVIVDVTSCNSGSKSASTVHVNTSLIKIATKKTAKLSPEILLKRVNPIPKYVPKAKQFLEWAQNRSPSQKKKPTQVTHPCDECGDIFIFESSLTMHMERRSVQISFNCIFCLGRSLMFYNKCSFFAHLRKHSQMMKVNMNYTSQIAKATVASLSYGNKVVVPVDVNKTGSSGNETTKSKDTTESSPEHPQSSDKESEPLEATDAQSGDAASTNTASAQSELSYKCKICVMTFKTMSALLWHMQYKQVNVLKCNVCKMELPNLCQLKAHTIMHSDTSCSWVCPECSQRFTSLKLFSTHITNNCLHWYRQMRIECMLCSRFVVNYTDHLDKGHEMLFYRCVSCAMAFKTLQSLKEHSEQKHKVQPGSPLCRIISKCPFCETVFMQKPLLLAHIRVHINQDKQLKSKYVYNCYICNTVYSNIVHFKKHFLKSHKAQKQFHCDYCRRRFLHYTDLLSHFKTGTPFGLSSKVSMPDGVCKAASCNRFENYVELGNDAKISESNSSSSDASESSQSNTTTDAKHKEQSLNKLYVKKTRSCPGCRKEGKVIIFQKETDLRSHMSKVHPQMKLSVINSEDCVKYVTIMPKESTISDSKNEDQINSNPNEDSRKRKTNLETDEDNAKQKRARTRIELPTEFDCAKCGHHSTDRSEFKGHIEAHRPDRSFSQCEECGICFRIEVPLRKHLFIQHGIREFKAYKLALQGNNSSPTPETDETNTAVTDSVPVVTPTVVSSPSASVPDKAVPLECKVCYKTFQLEGTLRVHMRNHGMAFIRSKRSMSGD